jgi:DNA-binding NtrC family response regulator
MQISSKILFVDDDANVLKTAELLLKASGYEFRGANSPAEAFSILAAETVDAILLDLNFSRAQMSGEEGLACLRDIRRHNPDAAVIIVTGHSGLTVAVQALRAGAHNFIMKPWNNERFLEAIEDALKHRAPAPSAGEAAVDPGVIIGACDAIVRVRELVSRYAPLAASVLLTGEPGTGKSLVAQALHRQSGREVLKIVEASDLTAAALENLSNTTLVIEDVDRLDPTLSLPLSAWLQSAGRTNSRVVATTTRAQGDIGLSRSLVYALSQLEMTLPPLRDRGDDIERLAAHFARIFALQQGMAARVLEPEAMVALRSASWGDNLHALRRVVERAVVAAAGPAVAAADLDLPHDRVDATLNAGLSLERTEKFIIQEALKRHNFSVSKAAIELGVTRQTLYRRMARHGL